MANSRQRPDSSAFIAENEFDVVLGGAYPNPSREGCPSADVIAALARRERPLDDPEWRHVFKCSPCYREVRALQQAAGERRAGFEEPRRRWRVVAAAAVLALAAAGGWFVSSRPRISPANDEPRLAASTEARASWDYRKYTVSRSDADQTALPPLPLPRGPERVTIQLPPGFLPGEYEVQLLDANLRSHASAKGVAEIREQAATLETTIDVSRLPAGLYQVAIRREGESWRLFPAKLE